MEVTLTLAEIVIALAGFVLAALLAYWQHRERVSGLREALYVARVSAVGDLADLYTRAYFFVDKARRLTDEGLDAGQPASQLRYEVLHMYRRHSVLLDQKSLAPLTEFIGSWNDALRAALAGDAGEQLDTKMNDDYRLAISALRACLGVDQLSSSLDEVLKKLKPLPD